MKTILPRALRNVLTCALLLPAALSQSLAGQQAAQPLPPEVLDALNKPLPLVGARMRLMEAEARRLEAETRRIEAETRRIEAQQSTQEKPVYVNFERIYHDPDFQALSPKAKRIYLRSMLELDCRYALLTPSDQAVVRNRLLSQYPDTPVKVAGRKARSKRHSVRS